VFLERGPGLVTAVHAVAGAGGAYLPLEPEYPDERLGFLVGDSGARVVVTSEGLADRVRGFVPAGVRVVVMGRDRGPVLSRPVRVGPEALAYVIYTSGSTGRPKGVGVSHRAIASRLWWMRDLVGIGPGDRVAVKTPFSFDVSVWELFLPALAGAGQVIAGPGAHRDSAALLGLIEAGQVTVAHFVPSMLDAFLAEPGVSSRAACLRVIVCSGEALSPALVGRVHELLPGAELYNLYGPTEAAVDVTWHRCRAGESPVPIGAAVPHTRIEILDPALGRVPAGVAGELCIGGVQVARGYLGRPGLTASVFVPDPYGEPGQRLYRTGDRARIGRHGAVEFLGRADGQVKIRGIRIELGEVRAELERDPLVRAAAVLVRQAPDGPVLTGYLVPRDGGLPGDWRAHLARHMPGHLIPAQIVVLDALPVTPNGKLDTRALLARAAAGVSTGAPFTPPATGTQHAVAAIWAEVLARPGPLSIHDNFFDLGGHSILALRMAMRLREAFDTEIPIASLLAAPTIEKFAAELDARTGATVTAGEDRIVPLRRAGDRPPLIFIHALGGQVFRYEAVARHLGEDQPVWAIPAPGLTQRAKPESDLDTMARAYASLIREAVPADGYVVGGFCIGGNIALEVARHLAGSGARIHAVFPVWSSVDEPVARASLHDDVVMMNHALAGGFADVEPRDLVGRTPEEQLLAVIRSASENDVLQVTTTDLDEIRRYLEVFRANAHAVGDYRHRPWPGRVVLFMPEDDPHVTADDDQGWSTVAIASFAIQPIPGSRYTAVHEPNASTLAALMRGHIDQAMRPGSAAAEETA
jgi:amino acid adenylation domain-containing protein